MDKICSGPPGFGWRGSGNELQLAAELALSPAQLALAWLKHRSCVTSTIIGGTSVAQLEENLSAWEVALDDEALEAIEAVHRSSMDPSFLL